MKNRVAQRLTALALLLAYLAVGTALIPGVVAMAADLDGSHEVVVVEQQGCYQIMLHHRANDFTPEVCDHHSTLARALTRFCTSTRSADHRVSAVVISSVSRGSTELLAAKPAPLAQTLLLQHGLNGWRPSAEKLSMSHACDFRPPRERQVLEAMAGVRMLV